MKTFDHAPRWLIAYENLDCLRINTYNKSSIDRIESWFSGLVLILPALNCVLKTNQKYKSPFYQLGFIIWCSISQGRGFSMSPGILLDGPIHHLKRSVASMESSGIPYAFILFMIVFIATAPPSPSPPPPSPPRVSSKLFTVCNLNYSSLINRFCWLCPSLELHLSLRPINND